MITTVLSDLGRVVLDFDNGRFFDFLAAYTAKPREEIRRVVHDNADLVTLFDRGALSPIDFYRNATDLLEADLSYEEFYRGYCDVFTPMPKTLALYRRIRPKVRMALCSNTDVMRWTHVKSRYPEILIFDAYVLSFEWGFVKPSFEFYRAALELVGAKPGEAVFVDDLEDNVAGAARAGMAAIRFRPETDLEAELAAVGVKA